MKAIVLSCLILASPLASQTKSIDGKIITYSATAQTAIINVGKDMGVVTGMKFTVYRGDTYVGVLVVRDVARDWSAATVDTKVLEPTAGDDVSNQILSPARSSVR
jgi:hypothetical protein